MGQLGEGRWGGVHGCTPSRGQGCCGTCETGEEQVALDGLGWKALSLRASASGSAPIWAGLHMPVARGHFLAKQTCCCPGTLGKTLTHWWLCAFHQLGL